MIVLLLSFTFPIWQASQIQRENEGETEDIKGHTCLCLYLQSVRGLTTGWQQVCFYTLVPLPFSSA